jgi:hypothetical protein
MSKTNYSPTAAQIAQWKKEHGEENILALSYPLEGTEEIIAVYRRPRLEDMVLAETVSGEDNIKKNLNLETSCRLGADPRVDKMDDVRFSMSNKLALQFKIKDVAVKKL